MAEEREWKENDITINGKPLSIGEAMTFRVAVTHFHQWVANNGLGDDEHGKAMVEAAAEVILARAGDEWAKIDWAMRIAEAALEAAFAIKYQSESE